MSNTPEDVSRSMLYSFKNLRLLRRSNILMVLHELRILERRSFASRDAFTFDEKILVQRNMEIFVGLSSQVVIAYVICVKWNHRLLLQKICVAPGARRRGIGNCAMEAVIGHARRWSSRSIDLWVDEANQAARGLYSKHGFAVQETIQDYYSPGRNGVKMVLDLLV